MHLGTVLVLIGAVLFFLALVVEHRPVRGATWLGHTLLAFAGLLTAVGVLLGAPALHA